MGTFPVGIEISDSRVQVWETVDALVDAGSTYTWIPIQLLGRLNVRPQFRREFETADGRLIQRNMAVTMVRWNGETMPTLVVFGEDNDAVLLGAYTLDQKYFSLQAPPTGDTLGEAQRRDIYGSSAILGHGIV